MTDSRLLKILKRHRDEIAPALSNSVLKEIADLEERYQYDDDRRDPQKGIRGIFEDLAQATRDEKAR